MLYPSINLKERFGTRWRIEYEESYRADRGHKARTEDPWLQVIPCQHGDICPWGGDLLAACSSGRGSIAKRLTELPFATVEQDGSDGVNVGFHPDHFEEVADIMRAKRKRAPQTEAQRRAAAENLARGKAYQFTAKNRPNSALESPVGRRRVSEHVRTAGRPF